MVIRSTMLSRLTFYINLVLLYYLTKTGSIPTSVTVTVTVTLSVTINVILPESCVVAFILGMFFTQFLD